MSEAATTPALPDRLEPVITYLEGIDPRCTFNPGDPYQCPLAALLRDQGAPHPFIYETHYLTNKQAQDPEGPPSDTPRAMAERGYLPVAPILVTLQRSWIDHDHRRRGPSAYLPVPILLEVAYALREDADAPAC